MCVIMAVIIAFSSVFLIFSLSKTKPLKIFDLFECDEVINDIKNYEMNIIELCKLDQEIEYYK